ncbi:MAG: hypothetical protein WCC30_17745, partial [Candidatus Dormiibacterota bacterium]
MTLSLRGRLLIGVISLVVVGLLIADVSTYALLRKSLFDRIDNQLAAQSTRNTARVVLSSPGCIVRGASIATDYPTGTVTELIAADGSLAQSCTFGRVDLAGTAPTFELPESFASIGFDRQASPTTVESSGVSYQLTYWREDSFGGQLVIFAIPLLDSQSTLSQLLLLELLIGLGVVAGTAVLAWLIIQIGLRPLQRMGVVADHIAAGDL